MFELLLILHLLGLSLAATGSFGGTVVLALAKPAQKQKGGPLRGLGPSFAHLTTTGMAILWPSGLLLMALARSGADSTMFLMKMIFAGLLTFAAASTEVIYMRARRGEPSVARLLPGMAPLSALSLLAVLVFSVLAHR